MDTLIEHSISLPDGRRVALAETGSPDGRPFLYFHGAGSSRREAAFYSDVMRAAGLRLIAPDRPGAGQSDPKTGRTVLAYADDIAAVTDALEIERFVVGGASAGGMYATAVAHVLEGRVDGVVPINSAGPLTDPVVRAGVPRQTAFMSMLADRAPRLTAALLRAMGMHPDKIDRPRFRARALRRLPAFDQGLLADAERMDMLMAAIKEGARQGPYCQIEDFALVRRPWGFDPYRLRVPVEVFSGDEDGLHGFAMALAERLPRANLHTFPGGHMALFAPDVLQSIATTVASVPTR